MTVVLGIASAVLLCLSALLLFRMMERTAEVNRLREDLVARDRDLKKVQGQLESQSQKFHEKAQVASKEGTKAKDQKQRIAQLSNELQTARAEAQKAAEKVKALASDVTRLRIEREELRKEMSEQKKRVEAEPAPARAAAETPAGREAEPAPSREEAPSPAANESDDSPRRRAAFARLEQDLERAEKDREAFRKRFEETRRRLVETTSDLRTAQRKAEHNRRAWIITQLQLDLLSDENYVLQHGSPPPMPLAEKAKKRASLRPKEAGVVADRSAEPIALPDFDALEREAARALAAARAEAEARAEEAFDEEPLEDAATELGMEPEEIEEAEIEEAPAARTAPEPASPSAERSTTRLRKSSRVAAVEEGAPAAPPRPPID